MNTQDKFEGFILLGSFSVGSLSVVDIVNTSLGVVAFGVTIVVGISTYQRNKEQKKYYKKKNDEE